MCGKKQWLSFGKMDLPGGRETKGKEKKVKGQREIQTVECRILNVEKSPVRPEAGL